MTAASTGNLPAASHRGARGKTEAVSTLVALLSLVGLGAIWRILYVAGISPFVDEYITMRAALKILSHGYPLLSSGNIYTHGIAHSYLVAGAFALLGQTETVARLPGLLISLLTIPAIWFVGRRMFDGHTALLAALFLALDPDAILWGGRARMYAFHQLCVLIAVYCLYRSDVATETNHATRYRFAFAAAYAGAALNHGITALLLPVMGLVVLRRRGVRGMFRRQVAVPFALAIASIWFVWILDRVGLPAMAMTAPFVFVIRHRPTFQPALDGAGMIKVIAPYTRWPYGPLTALFLLGLAWKTASSLRPGRRNGNRLSPIVYGYLMIFGVLLEIFFLVGHTWKSPRYLFMLLPLFYLLVSKFAVTVLKAIAGDRPRVQQLALALLALAVLIPYLQGAQGVLHTRVWGYDGAFRWLRDRQGAGDVVLTVNAPACAFILGECDYVAVEKGFEGYALQDDRGRWVGGWSLTPLLTSPDQLETVLDRSPTTWFVVDRRRLHERYTPAFVNLVQQRMDLVYEYRGAMVFRSHPVRARHSPLRGVFPILWGRPKGFVPLRGLQECLAPTISSVLTTYIHQVIIWLDERQIQTPRNRI